MDGKIINLYIHSYIHIHTLDNSNCLVNKVFTNVHYYFRQNTFFMKHTE